MGELPEEVRVMRDTIRRFVEEELDPIADQVEEEDRIPDHIVERMRELGLFGMVVPEEYGGLGLSMLGLCAVMEELSRANLCFRIMITTNNGIGSLGVLLAGTEEQKRVHLPLMASGERIGCFCLTEPEAGSDAAAVRTTAVRAGDHYVLNGEKNSVSYLNADVFYIFARTDPESSGPKGISAFLVPREMPGLSFNYYDDMGCRAVPRGTRTRAT